MLVRVCGHGDADDNEGRSIGVAVPAPGMAVALARPAYEVGAKWALLNNALGLDAAVFQITKTNARSQNPDSTYTADGAIRVRGG